MQDILAVQACYVVQGLMTEHWEALPERQKDYIAEAKPNGYRSLHCTIRLPPVTVDCGAVEEGQATEECSLQGGPTCELQIRTQRKHYTSPRLNASAVSGCISRLAAY